MSPAVFARFELGYDSNLMVSGSQQGIPVHAIEAFCERWRIANLWLFGSLARGTARPDSDADILVEFLPDATASTWDWPQMQDELREIFSREVDLLSMGVLRNPFRRETILASRKLLYAA